MKDYRRPENRKEYFTALYELNLKHGIMPGLVYLYMPALAKMLGWDAEQKLWFAFLNGLTQNPITSLILFLQAEHLPRPNNTLDKFGRWFGSQWSNLEFDTDRKYQKKDTIAAIRSYAKAAYEHGSQEKMLTGSYQRLWDIAIAFPTFGRLSTFSYLEYVHLNGFGADCTDMMFRDKAGSRSHRNGMLLLIGNDHLVWDKRQPSSHDGDYAGCDYIFEHLEESATTYLAEFNKAHPKTPGSRFTLESNLCTFKNHFYGHRYPGVYADMAWQRILHAEQRGYKDVANIFKDIRTALPRWLRMECETNDATIKQRAKLFQTTGYPYRAGNFL